MTGVKKWYASKLADKRLNDDDFLVVDYRDFLDLEQRFNALQFEFMKSEATLAAGSSPSALCRQRLISEGKPYPKSSCQICGTLSPSWQVCDAAIAAEKDNKGQ